MKHFKVKIPQHIFSLLKRLGIVLLMLQISRLIFFAYNQSSFPNPEFSDVLVGIWFDIITICLIFLPYSVIYLIPVKFRANRWYKLVFKLSFHLFSGFMLLLNLIDTAYFPYTLKRSSRDLIDTIFVGNDVNQLFTTFLSENILLIVLFISLILLTEFLYRKTTAKKEEPHAKLRYLKHSGWLLFIGGLLVLVGRGVGLKPIGILDAANYTTNENTALILNTPFTFLKTIAVTGLEEKNFFSQEKEKELFNPIHSTQPANLLPDKTNVVVIILESFGSEFVGPENGKASYSPFLDSLMNESLYFPRTIANGKKSIEALPAIIASLPSWTNGTYLSSPYSDNTINSLPSILKENGYSSAFFHGATNGSMSFDGFASVAGFDSYFGKNEYPNQAHYDGTWGITDAYFNPWVAKKITKMKEPFCSVLFTISSHHPYITPDEFKKFTTEGPQEICGSISYGDYALRLFFEEAKKQPWYDNTLFVFVADHSPASITPLYSSRTHLFRIPLAFYHPKGLIKPENNPKLAQQLDIFPTILDLINIKSDYYSFGTSLLQSSAGQGIAHLDGSYYHFVGDYMTTFSSDKAQKLFNFTKDEVIYIDSLRFYKKHTQENELVLKAMIQRYNRDLITNKTRVQK